MSAGIHKEVGSLCVESVTDSIAKITLRPTMNQFTIYRTSPTSKITLEPTKSSNEDGIL